MYKIYNSHLLVVDHIVVPIGRLEVLLRLSAPLFDIAQVRVGGGDGGHSGEEGLSAL